MMKSSAQSKNRSVHGAELLRLLRDPPMALGGYLERILTLIDEDPLAGLLKSKETGNTAFHYILQKDYPDSFVLPVLEGLLRVTPSGAKAMNNITMKLPIHVAAARPNSCAGTSKTSSLEIMTLLVDAYSMGLAGSSPIMAAPSSSLPGGLPESPLHIYLRRREIPNSQIVAKMCSSCKNIASVRDKAGNTPLHLAVNKSIIAAMAEMNVENVADHPENIKTIEILLDHYPEAASILNNQASMPLHLLCANCTNLELVKLVHSFHPSAVETCDIYNKTCLHLATLAVGKNQTDAMSKEERELQALADMKLAEKSKFKGSKGGMSKEELEAYKQIESEAAALQDDDDDEYDLGIWNEQEYSQASGGANALNENLGVDRSVISWLIEQWPEGLVRNNNFGSAPVETVLEKTKPERTRKKIVSVYGLYDDPPTARMLLLAHVALHRKAVEMRKLSKPGERETFRRNSDGELELDQYGNPIQMFKMPPLPARHRQPLAELNYFARREALLVSFAGQPYPSEVRTEDSEAAKKVEKKKKGRHLPQNKAKAKAKAIAAQQKSNGVIEKHNLLARLRYAGHVYIVQNVIQYL
jgi:hypothetical protein